MRDREAVGMLLEYTVTAVTVAIWMWVIWVIAK